MAKRIKKATKKSAKPRQEEKGEAGQVKKTRIRVIGIGGGGSSIAAEIASRVKKASFVVANTDRQALRGVGRRAAPFQFGEKFTHGLGTGMNPLLAETASQEEKERIKKILQGQDLVILIATLGGGVGSGAAPIFAKVSQNLGNLTYGIFTLPFGFEGAKKMEIARSALEKLKLRLNTLTILPNERIFQVIDKTTPLRAALSAINKSLAESLEGLIETVYEPGLINIDFADVKTILEGRGRLAYLNSVEAPKKESSAKEAIEKVLHSPLYPYSIRGAKGVLFNISGEKDLELSEVSQISKTISDLVNKEAKIIFGISQSKKHQNIIKTTLLATGCQTKIFSKEKKRRKRKKEVVKKEAPTPPVKKKKRRTKKKRKITPKPKIKAVKKPKRMKEEKTEETAPAENRLLADTRVRKNALQLRKEAEEVEKELAEKEKFWETPAFLRKGKPV